MDIKQPLNPTVLNIMTVPCDLVYEILCRLPVKSLLRFRCVSKHWCSLIDSTDFVEKHIKTSIKLNTGGIIIRGDRKFYLADYESLHVGVSNVIEINDPLKDRYFDTHLVGSAKGLVCLSKDCVDGIVLLNPSTRKCRKLDMEPAELSQSFYYNIDIYLCGFGYDHVSDDYKVVKVAVRHHPYDIMVLVFSLKTNSWTRLENVCLSRDICFEDQWGRFASGALYWPAIYMEKENSCLIMVRFDLGLEQFTEAVDSVEGDDYFSSDRLVALGGSLHILDYDNSRVDVSQINDYGMQKSRSKVFSVNGSEFGEYGLRTLAYSKNRQEVVMQVDKKILIWYHLQSEAVRKVCIQTIHGIPKYIDSHSYTESLFRFTEGWSSAESHHMIQNQRNIGRRIGVNLKL